MGSSVWERVVGISAAKAFQFCLVSADQRLFFRVRPAFELALAAYGSGEGRGRFRVDENEGTARFGPGGGTAGVMEVDARVRLLSGRRSSCCQRSGGGRRSRLVPVEEERKDLRAGSSVPFDKLRAFDSLRSCASDTT